MVSTKKRKFERLSEKIVKKTSSQVRVDDSEQSLPSRIRSCSLAFEEQHFDSHAFLLLANFEGTAQEKVIENPAFMCVFFSKTKNSFYDQEPKFDRKSCSRLSIFNFDLISIKN